MKVDTTKEIHGSGNPTQSLSKQLFAAGLEQFRSAINPAQKVTGALMVGGSIAGKTVSKLREIAIPIAIDGGRAFTQYCVRKDLVSSQAAGPFFGAVAMGVTILATPMLFGALDDVIEAVGETIF